MSEGEPLEALYSLLPRVTDVTSLESCEEQDLYGVQDFTHAPLRVCTDDHDGKHGGEQLCIKHTMRSRCLEHAPH